MSFHTNITDEEFAEILERNGFPGVAENIRSGTNRTEATFYIVGSIPLYDDGEGRWLHDYIDSHLHGSPQLRTDYRMTIDIKGATEEEVAVLWDYLIDVDEGSESRNFDISLTRAVNLEPGGQWRHPVKRGELQ